jgi:zinc protease
MMRAAILSAAMLLAAGSCGPPRPPEEPAAPDDGRPDVEATGQFLETSPIPPEVMAAIEEQRDLVVPQPDPLGGIAFDFPEVERGELENGLTWYLVERPTLPVVSLNLVVRAGMAHDPAELPGLAVFVGDMLREGGTTERSSRELSAEIEQLGADLTILTGADYTMVAVDGLSGKAEELALLMAETVTRPGFDPEELERFRQREKHRITLSMSDPEWVADKVFLRHLYGDHPYASYDTSHEALERMTRDDVTGFHERHYVARNASFVAVGDIDAEELTAVLETAFGDMDEGSPVELQWPDVPEREGREVVVVDRPGSAQTVIRIGNTTLEGGDPDALELLVTNHALGGNASSRLFMTLREDEGLTYGCYSRVPLRVDVGAFVVETSTKSPSTVAAVEAILEEIRRLQAEDPEQGAVTADELESYQRYLAGVLSIKAQAPSRIADLLIDQVVYGLAEDYYDTYDEDVKAVDPQTLRRTAEAYIHLDRALIVLVGDAGELEEEAARWGPVTRDQP